jgi:TnpA family transposase
MKQDWTHEELENNWTMSATELSLLKHKTCVRRLSFALMLKFYQIFKRFPFDDHIPHSVISHIAGQVGAGEDQYSVRNFTDDTGREHRSELRLFFGIRRSTSSDADGLVNWLIASVIPDGNWSLPFLVSSGYEYFENERAEPFNPGRMERTVSEAVAKYEQILFAKVASSLSGESRRCLDRLIESSPSVSDPDHARLNELRTESNAAGVDSVSNEAAKIGCLRRVGLPSDVLSGISPKILQKYASRVMAEPPNELRAHCEEVRHAMLAMFCHVRLRRLTDNLTDLLIRLIQKFESRAENGVSRKLLNELKHVKDKRTLLYKLSRAAIAFPEGKVKDVIFPVTGEDVLHEIIEEYTKTGSYRDMVQEKIRSSYMCHYRRILSPILRTLDFRSSNHEYNPVVEALGIIRKHIDSGMVFYPDAEDLPVEGIASDATWRNFLYGGILEKDEEPPRIRRINYEMTVLHSLCEHLKCKGIWVDGADEYRNPDEDLPQDFEERKDHYHRLLGQPVDADEFIAGLKETMRRELETLNEGMPENRFVKVLGKKHGHIKVTPLVKQPDPVNTAKLKQAVTSRWASTTLLDVLKETDLRLDLCSLFETTATRQHLDHGSLVRRLLLCLYGYGTNTGLKRVSSGNPGVDYQDLRYVRRRFIDPVHVRNAIVRVTDAIFETRLEEIWGEATTACAGDSVKFGSWDQNLMTEWHVRYRGPGVMIYWHVEKNFACIYSQLKRCSSSEVASMIKGIIDHCTKMEVLKGYSDTHGQSLIGFAFTSLLNVDLLPRLKGIDKQKLYLPDRACSYGNLEHVLRGAINWKLIREQYGPVIKFASAIKAGTADPEAILRRFTKNGDVHPVYCALLELGKAVKTIFLCRYLHSEELRREIHEALNVVESWNGTNSFIFYGRHGEMSSNRRDEQEMSMLCLHLLQNCLVYINTIMIQTVLAGPEWKNRLTDEDRRALCPLIFEHINPYGLFPLDLSTRINFEGEAA